MGYNHFNSNVEFRKSMKIFVFDPLWNELVTPTLISKLEATGAELVVETTLKPLHESQALFDGTEERILCLNPDYVNWDLKAEDYRDIPNLKAILIASTSFSWVNSSYADEKNIPICNIRHFSTEAVAEWAVMMMFNLARRLPLLIKDGFPLDFGSDYMRFRGIELKGKTVGIIGLGHNGSVIAERCIGLGMEVIYWSRSSTDDHYKRVELLELMSTADIIVPAFAKNEESNQLITEELLASIKPSAIVIDIIELESGREIILEMVKSGNLFGYGFEAKPQTFNEYSGNVWAAPAYAWATDGSMSRSMERWVENMVMAIKSEYPTKIN